MNTEEIKHIRDLVLADMLNGDDKTINGCILRKLDEQLTIPDVSARLYSLQLGERLEHNHLDYFRVPGGWVVVLAHGSGSVTSTFVPFNNEFQNVR